MKNSNKNVTTVTNFIEEVQGVKTKIYQLDKSTVTNKEERTRANQNILFDELYQLAQKQYNLAVVNEEMTGGILYSYGTKENRYATSDLAKQAIDKHLSPLNKHFRGIQGNHIPSKYGSLIKIPFAIRDGQPYVRPNTKLVSQ